MLTASIRSLIAPKGWPTWLPLPASRPELLDFADSEANAAGADTDTGAEADADLGPASGWFCSSLDLRLGLEVVELGLADQEGKWERAFA